MISPDSEVNPISWAQLGPDVRIGQRYILKSETLE